MTAKKHNIRDELANIFEFAVLLRNFFVCSYGYSVGVQRGTEIIFWVLTVVL